MTSEQDRKKAQEVASKLYESVRNKDPLPDIAPALLNSADIEAYVHKTAMIHPFDRENLKSASYEGRIGKWAIYWDENGKRQVVDLENDGPIALKPNGLVFVSTYERFHLPNYLAVRFNLRINIVHSGLLLGTGPLVDPGFEGHLLIPLHNLTINEFPIRYNDKFIWIEFTKVSPHEDWNDGPGKKAEIIDARGQNFEYKPFHKDKRQDPQQPLVDYLIQYVGNVVVDGPLMNAVPDDIRKAMALAKKAADEALSAKKTFKRTRTWGIVGVTSVTIGILVAIGIGVSQLLGAFSQLTLDATDAITETRMELADYKDRMRTLEQQLTELARENAERKKRFEEQQSETPKPKAPE